MRVIPIHWYDEGRWEFFTNREECPDPEADPVEIPDEMLNDYKQATKRLEDASEAIAGAVTDYIDKHPGTSVHWNVKNVVHNVRIRRKENDS